MLPEREHSGLYPVEAWREPPPWTGRRHGLDLPRFRPEDGLVASANEARQFSDGKNSVNAASGELSVGPH